VLGIVVGAAFLMAVLTAFGSAYVAHAELQQAADIAARAIEQGGGDEPGSRAERLARANGAGSFGASDQGALVRVRVTAPAPRVLGVEVGARIRAEAYAERPVTVVGDAGPNPPGTYSGPLEVVDGVRACPVVAAAFRRMDAAAAASGITLTPTSGFRGYAEQAALYAALGPKIAAPPGTSRHHDATEFDIAVGPAGSPTHRWLQSRAPGFGFIQRYSWEPWHWGYLGGC